MHFLKPGLSHFPNCLKLFRVARKQCFGSRVPKGSQTWNQAKSYAICLLAFLTVFGADFVIAQTTPVNLELSLVVDNSGSISNQEFDLQMVGYANGFRTFRSEIASFPNGMAVNLIFFDSVATEAIQWTHLTTEAEVDLFADALEFFVRLPTGGTNIAAGMMEAHSIVSNNFDGEVLIVDVSGDGTQNPAPVQAERDSLLASGVDRINGLAIGPAAISDFYSDNVIGGTDAFVIAATDFDAFEQAILDKLQQEIGDTLDDLVECTFESNNILCDLDAMGQPTGDYIVNGVFTNLQDIPGTHFLLPPDAVSPAGVELCFGSGDQVLQLPAPLNNGDSFEIGADTSNEEAIIIKNAMPGEEVCFRIVLLGNNGVECCTVEVCFEMPPCDCLQVDRRLDDLGDAFFCLVDPTTGDITLNGSYTFQLTNLFGQDVHHCFLAPLGDNIFTTDFFDLVAINSGPLGQGQSVLLSTNILAINPPGGNVEFLVTIHNEDFSECCTRVHSIFLPSCTSEPAMLLGDINEDGGVNLLDVQPFVDLITNGQFDEKADTNMDGSVNLLDIGPFIDILNP